MKVIKMLAGDKFYSLVEFFKTTNGNLNEDFAVNNLEDNIFFTSLLNGKVFPSLLSIISFIAIILLFIISFILPFMTIVFNLHAPVSVAAPLAFISVALYTVAAFIAFWLVSRGRWSGMAIFCCMIYIQYFLFTLSLLLIFFTDDFYCTIKIVNICALLLSRKLINSHPFNEIIKNYIYMRLFMTAMGKLRRDKLTRCPGLAKH